MTDPADVADPLLVDRYLAALSPEELDRLTRFGMARLRHPYLVTRALVRDVLSRYAGISPAEWQFTANRYGRPEIASPAAYAAWRFNLSHTDGLIVLAVSRDVELGVDVENVERRWSGVALAERYFAPTEVAELLAQPEAAHRETFFAYWTLKEAYIKARGMGLAIPLAQFSYSLSDPERPTISFDAALGDDPQAWQFLQLRPTPRHRVALAIQRSPAMPVMVRTRRIVPMC